MKLLEERIKRDGQVLDGDVLKINSFLNHQVDPELMMELGKEFARLFKDAGITKVLTCEASGIAPSVMAAYVLGVPMVFARKKKPSTLNDAVYLADVFSYTKKVNNKICVEKKFLSATDKVLILDDFVPTVKLLKEWFQLQTKPVQKLSVSVQLLLKISKVVATGLRSKAYALKP